MYSKILVLAMLQQGPRHGYEIKKDIDRALGGMIFINNKTLYLVLKRFEEVGAVTRQMIQQTGKPNRHLLPIKRVNHLRNILLPSSAPAIWKRGRRALAEKGSLLPHTNIIRLPHETSYPSRQGVSAVWAIS